MRSFLCFALCLSFLLVSCGRDEVSLIQDPVPTPRPTKRSNAPMAAAASPEASSVEKVYYGRQKGRPCWLNVHRQWYEKDEKSLENYRLEVSTSYEHDGQGLGRRVLVFSKDATQLLWEEGEEFLKIDLPAPLLALEEPSSFTLRWRHGRHFHEDTCEDLR